MNDLHSIAQYKYLKNLIDMRERELEEAERRHTSTRDLRYSIVNLKTKLLDFELENPEYFI